MNEEPEINIKHFELNEKLVEIIDKIDDMEMLRNTCKFFAAKSEAGFAFAKSLIEILEEYLPDMPKLSDAEMLDFYVAYSTELRKYISANWAASENYLPKLEE